MPLQNRVDPFSRIHAADMRGMFVGNRGILHDAATRTLIKQTWSTDGWVTCALAYKDWQAPIMGPSHWTELFFFDEAVALAAGYSRMAPASAANTAEMKRYLRKRSADVRPRCDPRELPPGAMFAVGHVAYLRQADGARAWHWTGYGPIEACPDSGARLTPGVSLAALRGGYRPALHASARS